MSKPGHTLEDQCRKSIEWAVESLDAGDAKITFLALTQACRESGCVFALSYYSAGLRASSISYAAPRPVPVEPGEAAEVACRKFIDRAVECLNADDAEGAFLALTHACREAGQFLFSRSLRASSTSYADPRPVPVELGEAA